jgi:deazaflavin-dependent oxidoreductase (nitroreductase family)
MHLGWLLGSRFLLLEHIGRVSGEVRRTLLEVVRHDRDAGTYVVASGWGAKSDWFRNVRQTPDVIVRQGLRRIAARAIVLPRDAGERELCDYAARHPKAFSALSGLMLGDEAPQRDCHALAEHVPVVALKPR